MTNFKKGEDKKQVFLISLKNLMATKIKKGIERIIFEYRKRERNPKIKPERK